MQNGDSNKTIARKLKISEGTVKVHMKAIPRKLRVRSRLQAAMWAAKKDLFATSNDSKVTLHIFDG